MLEALRPIMQAERAASFSQWSNAIVESGLITGEYRVLDALDVNFLKNPAKFTSLQGKV